MKRTLLGLLLLCGALFLFGCQKEAAAPAPTEAPVTSSPGPTVMEAEVELAAAPTKTPAPAPTSVPTPTPTATPEPTPSGLCGGRYPEVFLKEGEESVLTDTSYQSSDVAIFIEKHEDTSKTLSEFILVYYTADIYVQDITAFGGGFANNTFKTKYIVPMETLANQFGAILAISGDYIRYRDSGLCARNGEILRTRHDSARDVCLITSGGVMEVFDAGNIDVNALLGRDDIWQIIGFGPALLDENGQVKTSFHSSVKGYNPRAVICYYEPGHYGFLLVDGRRDEVGEGLTMENLSKLVYSMGCTQAFNLDGGATATLYFNGKVINSDKTDRDLNDIFYILPAIPAADTAEGTAEATLAP